jgi:1-acyl-sn-glycerol-3-phosphate acyltransferase
VAFIVSAAVITTASGLLHSRRAALRLTRCFIRLYGVLICALAYPRVRVQVKNPAHVPAGEPCLFISNHQSIADIFLMARLPKQECVFISNRWPFRIPVLGLIARLAGYLSIQTTKPAQLFDQAAKLLSDRVSIISFPEGTRSRTGVLGHFHTTVFKLALHCKVPIIPICIAGNRQIMPPGCGTIHSGTARMHILPAISPESYKGITPHQLKRRARDLMARELASMEGTILCN